MSEADDAQMFEHFEGIPDRSDGPRTATGRALWANPMDFPLGTGDSESPFLLAILATEAEAAALNVEALAEATYLVTNGLPATDWPDEYAKYGISGFYNDEEWADLKHIAAEYARLAAKSEGEPPL